MKKYIIIPFCFVSLLNGMITQQPPTEAAQREAAIHRLLKEYKVALKNKNILNIGSNIEKFTFIGYYKEEYPVDTCSNINEWSTSDCKPVKKYDIITCCFYLDLIENKYKYPILKQSYNCLKDGGELIFNMRTTALGIPTERTILQNILTPLIEFFPTLKENKTLPWEPNGHLWTELELYQTLEEIGFTKINLETKFFRVNFKHMYALNYTDCRTIKNRPFMQSLDPEVRDTIFSLYIKELFKTFKKDGCGNYYNPDNGTTIIRCFKGAASKL
jgi:hypothetical protein